jgi:hypothetical protein
MAAITLYPHQVRAVNKLLANRGLLCIHSTGSGKTLLAAAAAKAVLEGIHRSSRGGSGSRGGSRSRSGSKRGSGGVSSPARAFVIARKSAVAQFAAEVHRFAPELSAQVTVGTHQAIMRELSRGCCAAPALLVVDEAHEYTNPKGKRFAEVQAAARRASFVLLLTATPIVNSAADLLVLTSIAKGRAGTEASVPSPEAILSPGPAFREWFGGCVDVHLVDKARDPRFPSVHRHVVKVPMSAATRAEYERRLAAPSPFFMNLRQLSLGAGKVSEKGRWLAEHARRWVEAGEGKIVVYSAFLDTGARRMRDLLTRAGLNVLVIDGKSSAKDRRRAALMFNRRQEEEPREELHRDLRALVRSRGGSMARSRSGGKGPSRACRSGVLVRREGGPSSFRYTKGATGDEAAGEAERLYAQGLAIPPPWSPAYVCAPDEKLQWVARDQTGKWQYRYSADWGDQQEYRKFLRLRAMSGDFPRDFARRVGEDIRAGRAKGASRPAVLRAQVAVAALLLSRCFFRVGAEGTTSRAKVPKQGSAKQGSAKQGSAKQGSAKQGSAKQPSAAAPDASPTDGDTSTFGVTSLRVRHVQEEEESERGSGGRSCFRDCPPSLRISFRGKSGQTNRCAVSDPLLASSLRWLLGDRRGSPSARLFGDRVTAAAVRRYLGDIRPGLRPKDFRTYAANLALLRTLLAGPDPTKLKPSQRARRLAEGYRAASRLLNNTPRMAKEAYVFSGLWVLYQVDPTRFLSAVGDAKDPAAALDRLVSLFEDNRIDWRYMLRWFKETGGVASFMGPAQVLLITDAGSESIDLAGTRHIVFLDATWTPALEDQIVGRGQRFGSHAHLPADQRRLDVWKLFLSRGGGATPEASVDAYMDGLNQQKRESQEALYRRLAAL